MNIETPDGRTDGTEPTRMMGPLSISEKKELIAMIKELTDLFIT